MMNKKTSPRHKGIPKGGKKYFGLNTKLKAVSNTNGTYAGMGSRSAGNSPSK